ncbi:gas vesicle accessory protein GvpU [Chromobacterium vaccinii]|uniref:gas vesicle accessory protein GvpU n=1 Tax=Chromobacterium vaccinii TaxID=1108595 RepID=UPI003C75DBDB
MIEAQKETPPLSERQTDWYLQTLVRLVNANPIEFGITLFVDGLIVSGFLISGSKYFEGLAEQIAKASGQELADAFTASPKEVYSASNDEEGQPDLPGFIHLREARVFLPGQKPIPADGTLWRGKLVSISGFNFGAFEYGEH